MDTFFEVNVTVLIFFIIVLISLFRISSLLWFSRLMIILISLLLFRLIKRVNRSILAVFLFIILVFCFIDLLTPMITFVISLSPINSYSIFIVIIFYFTMFTFWQILSSANSTSMID